MLSVNPNIKLIAVVIPLLRLYFTVEFLDVFEKNHAKY
jgi:hypothetical protein